MLTALTTGLRFRLAILFATFASLCFVARPAVLAFGHGEATVDCMAHADMVDHGKLHAHDQKPLGDHSSPAGSHQPSCCSLFFMSALVADIGVIGPALAGSAPHPAREPIFLSRLAERLDRPPISLCIV
jgi:hypothetical protein